MSRKARYALRALYALAADEARGPVLISDLGGAREDPAQVPGRRSSSS